MAALSYPTQTAMVRNILREYRATNADQRRDGRIWYAVAYSEAEHLREIRPSLSLEHAAGIIAALSPQTQWWQNVMLARQVVTAGAMVQGHTEDTMVKVNRILVGEDPAVVLGGQKVRAFWQNIVDAGWSTDVVTIDRHAWRTACGRHELGKRNQVPQKGYPLAVDAFKRAAQLINAQEHLNLTPAQLQAIVWVPRAA